ncbi:MAG: PKD domain-containing protein [Flavobacteriales bacterium]|nr:PKD domain-containing protein [Flavobacteriales bacterium]
MKRLAAILSLASLAISIQLVGQCTHDMDLNSFSIAGPLGNGQWSVSPDGSEVSQDVNGLPTFFVSPFDMMNVTIRGKVRVDSLSEDNDYIGFVFGVQSPTNYTNNTTAFDCWLIDWKSDAQTSADEGFSLINMNYTFDFDNPNSFMPFFWTHNTISGFQITNTFYEEGSGWEMDTEYEVEFQISPTRMIFKVDDQIIFNKQDCFEPGRFGLYNFSQAGTVFSDFYYEVVPDFSIPGDACMNEEIGFQLLDANCSTASDLSNSVINAWEWDFGDGTTSYQVNPVHEFASAGNFVVTLTLTDEFGCESQSSESIEIQNGPTAAFEVSSGCTGEELYFTNLSSSNGTTILSTQWDIDSDGIVDYVAPEVSHTYEQNGSYQATLIVTSQTCADTTMQLINLFPSPTTSFLVEQVGNSRTFEFTNLSVDAASYLWDFGDPGTSMDVSTQENPSYTYANNGEYDVVLTAFSAGGCSREFTLKAFVEVDDDTFVPTAFSPNSDGKNDYFRILGYDFSSINYHIYNQWGELIFLGNNLSQGWDGTAKGAPAEIGNYTYLITATTIDGLQYSYQGVVALIR